jgi:hypothetical protein
MSMPLANAKAGSLLDPLESRAGKAAPLVGIAPDSDTALTEQ